jgi:hypothetical protein
MAANIYMDEIDKLFDKLGLPYHGRYVDDIYVVGNDKARMLNALPILREALKENKIHLPDGLTYSAWYLWNMTYADYPKAITTDEQRATFVEETLLDPDCDPAAVLECFVAKMSVMKKPIFWENYL